MAKIRILADQVVNQIAAGEVVERPAAVVKELLENSLDAGAKRIEVEFRNGGKSYMRVEDDGCGMTPDDALLSLERHATSKIVKVEDLMKVRSFGFRGEAVPSIASVSRFTLRTRPKELNAGCEVLVDGGRILHKKDYGMAVGTQIEVANLFNTVPVRRKFMKTENTEAAHIINLVRLYAVSNPGVAFTLLENGRIIFKSSSTRTLQERIASIWTVKLTNELISVQAVEGGMRLEGLIGKPGVGRSTRAEMVTLVNGRPVESKTLNYAIIESYHTFIPKGRYPVVFLFLEINPAFVDVNVHPAKKEVRFRDEGLIRQFVIRSLLDCLSKFMEPVSVRSNYAEKVVEVLKESKLVSESEIKKPNFNEVIRRETVSVEAEHVKSVAPIRKKDLNNYVKLPEDWSQKRVRKDGKREETIVQEIDDKVRGEVVSWRYLGKVGGRYALMDSGNGLIVMNLKAAMQRVWYEKIQKQFKDGQQASQVLLFPIPLELDALAAAAFQEQIDVINRGGFRVELFGRNFYRIEAVPEWLEPAAAEQFIKDVAGLIRDAGVLPRGADVLHEKIAKLAVTEAIQAREDLGEEAIEKLAQQLLECKNPLTCPRGKRAYFEVSLGELERKFGGF